MLHVFLAWPGNPSLKKTFFKILNGSILFGLLSSRKISTTPYKIWKKVSKDQSS
jgi:hypothetical protein